MAWRKHDTHREESQAVKTALAREGIKAKVGHGTGTAWGWLKIRLGSEWNDDMRSRVIAIAQQTTGRHGDYSGEINVHFDQ